MKKKTKHRLQEMLDQAIEREELAGGCLLVRKDGEELVYLEGGMADREAGRPISRDQIYRLYSMSKPVTAAAVMKLMEDGLVDLAEPVAAYIPAFEGQRVEENGWLVPAVRGVTVKDLLDMTSGLTYGGPGAAGEYAEGVFSRMEESLLSDHPMTTQEFAGQVGAGPLLFQPGSSWRYGTSADVLGAVVETVSGMSFGEYLEKNIFGPLGMKDTGFWVPEKKAERLVKTYRRAEDGRLVPYLENHLGILNAMDRKPAFESGGAGLVSTVDDYARFAQMLLNEGKLDGVRVLHPETVRFMTAGSLTAWQEPAFEQNFANMPGFTYGNLMRVMKYPGHSATLSRAGEYGWDGWLGCYFANDPAERMTMLFMMQKTDSGMISLVRRMRNVIMSEI